MRKLIMKMSVSLDGFVADSNGQKDWLFKTGDEESLAWSVDQIRNAGLIIMGRKSFETMAPYWPTATGPFAAPMNEIPKAVFTRKGFKGIDPLLPSRPSWAGARVFDGDLAEGINELKAASGKPIVAIGGAEFMQSLVATSLIDEYHLAIHPVCLAKGLPIFTGLDVPLYLKLVDVKVFSERNRGKDLQRVRRYKRSEQWALIADEEKVVTTTGVIMANYKRAGEVVTGTVGVRCEKPLDQSAKLFRDGMSDLRGSYNRIKVLALSLAIAWTIFVSCLGRKDADQHQDLIVRNSMGMQLMVAEENTQPTLRIVLPDHPTSDRAIEVLFPEHVTVREHGSTDAYQLYMFRPRQSGEPPQWRRSERSLEYERSFPGAGHMLARATLEEDGVRFHFKLSNQSDITYDLVYAPIDPRLTSEFHDVRLERTYVHHADGFDLLASEMPSRLTMPLNQWLPNRYLASFTWPIPSQRSERREGIMYHNKSRAVDAPFIATLSQDGQWVVASFTRNTGNVWSNPELTCQHVDPQAVLAPGEEAILETKILVVRGSLEEVFEMAMRQRETLNSEP